MNPTRQLILVEVLVVVAIVATIAVKVIPFFIHRTVPQCPTIFGIVVGIAYIVWRVWRIRSSRKSR